MSSRPPLSNIRVIEMGAFIAGPFCGQLLADFGADVIKIEPPGAGDAMRQWGVHEQGGVSTWWPVIGRNKRSMTIDLRRREGQALARKLIAEADVLVENFRPGVLEKWNLDPDELRRAFPKLIVVRVSGFGQTGPFRDRPGFAAVAEAAAGLRVLTGEPDRQPSRVGISIGDSLAGMFAMQGVLSALYARDTRPDGEGQIVDVAIVESVLAVIESVVSEFSVTGRLRQRTGSVLPGIAPSNIYPTSDNSWLIIAANADGLFRKLAALMGTPALASDERFASHQARGRNQRELDELVREWTARHERDALIRLLSEAGIPAGPLNTAADLVREPHLRARQAIVDVPTETFGSIAMQGVVPKLSATPGEIRWAGPKLGEHTEEVCREIGLDPAAIGELRAAGLV